MSGDADYYLSRVNAVRSYVASNATPHVPYPRKDVVAHFRSKGWGNCGHAVSYLLTQLQYYGRLKHKGKFVIVDSDRVHWPVIKP